MVTKEGSRGARGRGSPRAFAWRFAALAAVLLGLYYYPYAPRGFVSALFHLYLSGYAAMAGAVLRIFDPSVHVTGTAIAGRASLNIVKSCDAMDVYALLAAAILASPARWPRRLFALAIAFGALLLVNVVRIVSLYYVSLHWLSRFELVHETLWPAVIVCVAAASFWTWARLDARPLEEAPHAVDLAHHA
ncbi:MAG TPA: archaeosortase/exosortase family protein [Polyangiaceae bacterium]|jgi:exosortase/archaeosortase family protein|nr:archaeosortase/exosortase family protein [Polyangiaceae bacterium]